MGFSSAISSKCVVITDDNAYKFASHDPIVNGVQMSRGWQPRDFEKCPFGSMPFAEPFNLPLIPESEWIPRIQEAEQNKTHLRALAEQAGLTVLDQNGTNYCWINAPTFCVMLQRVAHGLPVKRLSPASVGAKIKNFSNQGGWGAEGLEYIVEHGLCTQETWPANAIQRQYDTSAANEERKKYRVREWWELPQTFAALVTCTLLNIPVAIGLAWWSHEVSAVRPVVVDGRVCMEIANSWGADWSDNGYGILVPSKATPDDAVAPRTVTPSE